jgi:phosphatidate cytidylyltransferase
MKQRIITGLVFTLVILAFSIPGYFYAGFIIALTALVTILATQELVSALQSKGIKDFRYLTYVGVSISFLPVAMKFMLSSPYVAFTVYAMAILTFSLIAVILPSILIVSENKIIDGIAAAGVSIYISFPIACANIAVLYVIDGWYYFALGLLSPWISDVFAYFTGVLIGKHKIVPHISPKKTWEGCIGGAIGCSIVVSLYFSFVIYRFTELTLPFPTIVIASAVVGLLLSVVSQLGDWMASALKRWAEIKDFGSILPGHGGIMDRFDSVFFTLPIALAFGLLLT